MDSSYTSLLVHLHQPTHSIPLETVQGVLAHHLAHANPSPTPLTAATISSPLFLSNPLVLDNLQALSTAFQHSIHLKYGILDTSSSGLFSGTKKGRMGQWLAAIASGFQGGDCLVRLAACGGILLGLQDLRASKNLHVEGGERVQEEAVVALAEVMDLYRHEYTYLEGEWESEWRNRMQSSTSHSTNATYIAVILCSRFLHLVSTDRLQALPLAVLSHILCMNITKAFRSGKFISEAPLDSMSSTLMRCIAPLSKLEALVLSLILDSRPSEGVGAAEQMLNALNSMSENIEVQWGPAQSEDLWSILKTFLFSAVMVSDSVLSTIVYVPPEIYVSTTVPSPSTLALVVLHTLAHLSFVVAQFGLGSLNSKENSFKELERTFYTALDIISSLPGESDTFVRRECGGVAAMSHKKVYLLACIEQLLPSLEENCIRDIVWPFCEPHLFDTSNREQFEAAHSTIVAVFSKGGLFAAHLFPYYAQCLVENSRPGRLTAIQLSLAWRALLSSSPAMADPSLVWFAITLILDTHPPSQNLRLMLIASVSAVSLGVLEHLLAKVWDVISSCSIKSEKDELVEALYQDVVERVGDVERAVVLGWWSDHFGTASTSPTGTISL